MFRRIRVIVPVLLILILHFTYIELSKRKNCKVAEMNVTLEFGSNYLNKNNCEIYWCSDDTHRFGDLLKYKCAGIVLRLYPDLTRECRRQKCIPAFTYDDTDLTDAPSFD